LAAAPGSGSLFKVYYRKLCHPPQPDKFFVRIILSGSLILQGQIDCTNILNLSTSNLIGTPTNDFLATASVIEFLNRSPVEAMQTGDYSPADKNADKNKER
jgi:hypothetical protein